MKKSEINPMPEYFDRYINLVADVELSQAFDQSIEQIASLDRDILTRLDNKAYQAGKWSAKEIIQHVTDFERILSYRTLLFARKEGSVPQGVDENALAANTNANKRTVESILGELKAVRLATKALFESFDNEMLYLTGVNWKYDISVLAMGFAIVGHQIHHFKIIEDKYYSLIS